MKRPLGEKIRVVAILLSSGVVGVFASLPVYADVYELGQQSSRVKVDLDFFLAVLPRFQSFSEVLVFISKTISPLTFGNPIRPEYPFDFSGIGFGVFPFWLFVLSTLTVGRRLWFWYLFIALCLLGTVSVPVYAFANAHLGFHFSRLIPLVGAIIPFFVAGSYAVDELCRGKIGRKKLLTSIMLTLCFTVLVPVLTSLSNPNLIDGRFVSINLLLIAILSLSFVDHYRVGVVIATLLTSVIASQCLLLVRLPETIRFSSSIVDSIRTYTDSGKNRFAKMGSDLAWFIPSSQESIYGIKSIHSYDSLSSRNFQSFVLRVSQKGTRLFGRWFRIP